MGLEGKAGGADLPKSPVMLSPEFKGAQPIAGQQKGGQSTNLALRCFEWVNGQGKEETPKKL
jgi:hypothetical protein